MKQFKLKPTLFISLLLIISLFFYNSCQAQMFKVGDTIRVQFYRGIHIVEHYNTIDTLESMVNFKILSVDPIDKKWYLAVIVPKQKSIDKRRKKKRTPRLKQ